MACCQKSTTEKKHQKKLPFGCCNNDMSNPFAQYCCCTGFVAVQQYSVVSIESNESNQLFTDTGMLIPNYYSNCWHPPELAA